MKSGSLMLALSLVLLAPGCKSEIDNKPAAEVSETSATTAAETSASTATALPAGGVTANVIKEKSKIEFVGAKVTRDHTGQFRNFDGTIEYVAAQPTKISFTIDLNSVETDTDKLTGHLKSPDFFDTATYPKATFTSTSLTPVTGSTDGTTHTLQGTLDLHGVQKDVTIPVKAVTSSEGVRATSEFTINRHDWGISYKGAADDLIKDNVLIKLDLMFPPPPSA